MEHLRSRADSWRWFRLLILVSVVCFPLSLWAKEDFPASSLEFSPNFEHITIEQGLSHGVVYSIVQDQQGFMWFGGEGGLVKYDGYNFTIYQHEPLNESSLSNNGVSYILVDQAGVIWCATWGGGINKLLPHTETFIHYRKDSDDPRSLSDDRVQVIYEDREGMLWFGTFRGGLNRF